MILWQAFLWGKWPKTKVIPVDTCSVTPNFCHGLTLLCNQVLLGLSVRCSSSWGTKRSFAWKIANTYKYNIHSLLIIQSIVWSKQNHPAPLSAAVISFGFMRKTWGGLSLTFSGRKTQLTIATLVHLFLLRHSRGEDFAMGVPISFIRYSPQIKKTKSDLALP